MAIKILGSGCAKCQRLEQLSREAASELGIAAAFDHVRDLAQIMEDPVVGTPAPVPTARSRSPGGCRAGTS